MKRIILVVAAGLLGFGTANAQQAAGSMGELLQQIEQGKARDSQEANEREARFAADRNQQQNLLNQARAERTRQERNSEQIGRAHV
jgi:biopolymer transport protein ExbB